MITLKDSKSVLRRKDYWKWVKIGMETRKGKELIQARVLKGVLTILKGTTNTDIGIQKIAIACDAKCMNTKL